jgi:hypothetical protein
MVQEVSAFVFPTVCFLFSELALIETVHVFVFACPQILATA